MPNPGTIEGTHHLTFCVGGAQEDYDFHVRTLGLKSVKKTVLFDGEIPIYHLYYANRVGDASTILTAFPYRQAGWMGKRGTNQAKSINVAVPAASIGYWADRLSAAGIEATQVERFGTERLEFAHPCGIPYQIVGETGDRRARALRRRRRPVRARDPRRLGHDDLGPRARADGPLPARGDELRARRLRGRAPPVPADRLRQRPDPRAGRGARPAAGHVALRRGHDPPPRLRRRHVREPAAREGLHRRPRLHRRLRRQGPRLLLQRLPAHAGRRAVRARLLDRRRASRSTRPRTSSARTCASRRTGRTGAPRSPSSSRSRRSRRFTWGRRTRACARAGAGSRRRSRAS